MAVVQLGGHPVTIRAEEVGFDRRESVEDVARTLGSYHSLIGARVVRHATLERMVAGLSAIRQASARQAPSSLASIEHVPVVNLLSDLEHPTQAVADLLTIAQEFGDVAGRSVAYVGDANNVCRSLTEACLMSGASMRIAAPKGYQPTEDDLRRAADLGGDLLVTDRPEEAAEGADVLYTDVWLSMGDDVDAGAKRKAFAGFSIDERLLERAAPKAIVLHCLPAHRDEEISAGALDGPQSRVWRQAENRMHAARAMFAYAVGDGAA